MPKAKKTTKARKKKARKPSCLRGIVGDDVYDVWVQMLKALVPNGRTHRLAILVASMLAYASEIAWSDGEVDDDDPAFPLQAASEGVDEEETLRLLKPMLSELFNDAKVQHQRVSSRGERYSILREAVIEFCHWHRYPWE